MDVMKAKRDLGFQARTSLREGLRATIDWYRAQRFGARDVSFTAQHQP
jgi:nucleoside-diphosphate-sugar epimerase